MAYEETKRLVKKHGITFDDLNEIIRQYAYDLEADEPYAQN